MIKIEDIPDFKDLTDKQQRWIALQCSSPNLQKNARAVGVSATAVYNWLKDEKFLRAYQHFKYAILAEVGMYAVFEMQESIKFLVELRNKKDEKTNERLKAALAILQFGSNIAEAEQIRARLVSIEEQIRLNAEKDKVGELELND